jgi:hypothetical protein
MKRLTKYLEEGMELYRGELYSINKNNPGLYVTDLDTKKIKNIGHELQKKLMFLESYFDSSYGIIQNDSFIFSESRSDVFTFMIKLLYDNRIVTTYMFNQVIGFGRDSGYYLTIPYRMYFFGHWIPLDDRLSFSEDFLLDNCINHPHMGKYLLSTLQQQFKISFMKEI